MQTLAGSETPKFRGEDRRLLQAPSPSGARYLPDDMGISLECLLGLSDRLDAVFQGAANFVITEFKEVRLS